MSENAPGLTAHFAALADSYDVILSDVWGVVHNGIKAHPDACQALVNFRRKGGRVVMITNAPRPNDSVARQIKGFGVPENVHDGIVSSGDVTRAEVVARRGQTLCHIGPERDRAIFAGLDVKFAPLETADYVVCSGLDADDQDTPDDYRERLEIMLNRRLFMVCGNPDVVVERGDALVYCAGAIADLYGAMGGEVLYAGKPYRPIYQQALALAGGAVPKSRVVAIGDSVRTDVKGAHEFGIDCVFLTAGIHAEELGGHGEINPAALTRIFAAGGKPPKAVMRRLIW